MKGNYKSEVKVIELVSYLILVIGTVLDHVSTHFVLLFPGGYEGNVFPAWLMSMNLGFLLDSILIPTLILTSHLLYSRFGNKAVAILLLNTGFGAWRFDAFFHNLHIFFHYCCTLG